MTILSYWTWRVSLNMAFRLFRIRLPRYMFDNKSIRYLHRRCFHIGRKLVRLHLQIILQDQDPSQVSCAFVDDDMQDDQEWSVLQLLSRVEKLSSLQSKIIGKIQEPDGQDLNWPAPESSQTRTKLEPDLKQTRPRSDWTYWKRWSAKKILWYGWFFRIWVIMVSISRGMRVWRAC